MIAAQRCAFHFVAGALGAALLALVGPAILPTAEAAYTFTKIADTATTAPGAAVPFSTFSDVCYDGTNIAFIGRTDGASGPEAIYQWNGSTLSRVVNAGDPVPSSLQSFVNVQNLSLDSGRIVFQASNSHDFQQSTFEGVYTNLGGSLRRVVDSTMTMPGSTAVFRDLVGFGVPSHDVAIKGDTIVFSGFGMPGGQFDEGVYRETAGVLSVVANRSTTLPGQTEPNVFYRGEIDVDDGHVLFSGDGLYTTAPTGSIRTVFDSNSSLPELTPPVSEIAPNMFSLDNGVAAFITTPQNGAFEKFLYTQQPDGTNRLIVRESRTNPVTNSSFTDLKMYYSLSNNQVLFSGWSSFGGESVDGLYLSTDTGFEAVISDLDTLDGKNLTGLDVFKESLINGNFAFEATFSDGSSGIYFAEDEGGTGTPQMMSIEPTFDVQLRPGNVYPLGDAGKTTLSIDGGVGASFPVLQVLAEFPLGGIPEGAQITSAQLKLDATTAGSSNLTINASGFAGDGLASLSDETIAATLLGSEAGPFTVAGDVTIDLDPNFIASLVGSASHLGLRLASATTGPFINIATLEHETGVAPTLVVNFSTDSAGGDFDLDADVDGNDFIMWQLGVGSQYDSADLATWQASFGPGAPTSVAAASVPEPASVALCAAALGAVLLAASRRSPAIRTA
jgi:hypothetical protein